MSDFKERAKESLARTLRAIWPVPLVTAVTFGLLGAGGMRLVTPRVDVDERMRKVALDRVMQDVRESKGFAERAGRDFLEKIEEYHAERLKRDAIVLDSSLSSLEKVAKVQALEPSLIEAERAIYRDPLAAVANKRTLFLEFVINKAVEKTSGTPDVAQAEAQP
jgi:hypothetical protein